MPSCSGLRMLLATQSPTAPSLAATLSPASLPAAERGRAASCMEPSREVPLLLVPCSDCGVALPAQAPCCTVHPQIQHLLCNEQHPHTSAHKVLRDINVLQARYMDMQLGE